MIIPHNLKRGHLAGYIYVLGHIPIIEQLSYFDVANMEIMACLPKVCEAFKFDELLSYKIYLREHLNGRMGLQLPEQIVFNQLTVEISQILFDILKESYPESYPNPTIKWPKLLNEETNAL